MQKDTRIYLEIEHQKIQREKAKLVLEKSVSLYIIFMLIAVLGFIFDYIDAYLLNTLIIVGIIILLIGTVPYVKAVSAEEKKIRSYLK